MKEIMISINPPFSKQIINGEKPMEFRKKVLNIMKDKDNFGKIKIYIYETKNKDGCGKVIGEAIMYNLFNVGYLDERIKPDSYLYTDDRYQCIRNLYIRWCINNNILPNMNEGWFKSKKFMKYIKTIGWSDNFNFAIGLNHVKQYEEPFSLGSFINTSGIPMKYPPQNMCQCFKR
ncbi:MAG TPA: hypothetical protein H9980_02150 [Candidatus Erysipelatoclostridium merdavium]|uniref:Uncharacterized protein n=1 Tax=Candidatus Erysipelatoclostridium merdavium TaxID=2838566 RepID=A0A9D2BLQ5_9FIRM|nr:hypothetical protein [Candidatus Erysipelatoclostridium merdavium]